LLLSALTDGVEEIHQLPDDDLDRLLTLAVDDLASTAAAVSQG
jgi:hypothetical protein